MNPARPARTAIRQLNPTCYLVTSGSSRRTAEVAAAAARAGAGIVQVRAKDLSAAGLLELTLAGAGAVERANTATRVVVNDRCDIAFAAMRVGAHVHGVHLGQEDLPVADARALLGPRAVIGLTTGTLELVRGAQAVAGLIDYVGAGPFRPTPTKDSGRPALGVEGYRPLVGATNLPVVAIGDVRPEDARALAGTGVAGVALVRGIMDAPDPTAAVREVLRGFAVRP